MKRVLATGMALAMLVSAMTVGAGAAYSDDEAIDYDSALSSDNGAYGGGKQNTTPALAQGSTVGTGSVDVYVKTGEGNQFINVYAIGYSTTELTFTYGSGLTYVWNPETLEYVIAEVTEGQGAWTAENGTVITVTNYSDLAVDVEATYEDAGNVTEAITVTLNDSNTATLNLAAAATTPNTATSGGEAQSDTITVGVSGDLKKPYSRTLLGTITMTVKVPTA